MANRLIFLLSTASSPVSGAQRPESMQKFNDRLTNICKGPRCHPCMRSRDHISNPTPSSSSSGQSWVKRKSKGDTQNDALKGTVRNSKEATSGIVGVGINRAHCGRPKHGNGFARTRPRRFSLYTSSLKICFCIRSEVISTTLDAHAKVTLDGKKGWWLASIPGTYPN